MLDATKAFPDLAERYARSNDDTELKALKKLKRSDCLMRIACREPRRK
jgi:hypothetical protein